MQTKKLFLASSFELKVDRDQFEIFIGRKNQEWVGKGVFLELVIWENFLATTGTDPVCRARRGLPRTGVLPMADDDKGKNAAI